MKRCMILFFMHDVDLVDYMMKVLLDIHEVVSSYNVDILVGCKGLWPHDSYINMCQVMRPYMYIALVDFD